MLPAAAWICSLFGLGLAYITLLGLGMSTVPGRLSGIGALGLAVLPLLAVLASGFGLFKAFHDQQQAKGVLIYIVPLGLALFTFIGIVGSYKPRWGKKANDHLPYANRITYHPDGEQPLYELEIRPILDAPEDESEELSAIRSDETYLVGKEVLFTGADVDVTWSAGPYARDDYYIGIRLASEVREKLKERSLRDTGKRWAVILNGKVLTAPTIAGPFDAEVVFSGDFDETAAGNYARGIVGKL